MKAGAKVANYGAARQAVSVSACTTERAMQSRAVHRRGWHASSAYSAYTVTWTGLRVTGTDLKTEMLAALTLAEQDITSAVSAPVWRRLLAEDPDFVGDLPAAFQLELLRLIHAAWPGFSVPTAAYDDTNEDGLDRLELLFEGLSTLVVDLDPWQLGCPAAVYGRQQQPVVQRVELGAGWAVEFRFAACDLSMEDVNGGCDERLSLLAWLEALFEQPHQDIRAFAQSLDLAYEPAMSPEDGRFFRFECMRLEHPDGFCAELGPEELPVLFDDDRARTEGMAVRSGELAADQVQLLVSSSTGLRPLFAAAPTVDEATASCSDGFHWQSEAETDASIAVSWQAAVWLPLQDFRTIRSAPVSDHASLLFERTDLNVSFTCSGDGYLDYRCNYLFNQVADARESVLAVLAEDRLYELYRYALGLTDLPLASSASPS